MFIVLHAIWSQPQAHAYTCMSRASRPFLPLNSDESNAFTAASARFPIVPVVHGPHPRRVVGNSEIIPPTKSNLAIRDKNLSDYFRGVRSLECGFSHLTRPDPHIPIIPFLSAWHSDRCDS